MGETTWERAKAALRRDWEQTKSDLTREHGLFLGQTARHTLRQIANKEPIPAPSQPTIPWEDAEPAVRFGYEAQDAFPEVRHWGPDADDWGPGAEEALRSEWSRRGHRLSWLSAKPAIWLGWRGRGTGL